MLEKWYDCRNQCLCGPPLVNRFKFFFFFVFSFICSAVVDLFSFFFIEVGDLSSVALSLFFFSPLMFLIWKSDCCIGAPAFFLLVVCLLNVYFELGSPLPTPFFPFPVFYCLERVWLEFVEGLIGYWVHLKVRRGKGVSFSSQLYLQTEEWLVSVLLLRCLFVCLFVSIY